MDGAYETTRDAGIAKLRDWIVHQGVKRSPFDQLLVGMCERLLDVGIPVLRVNTAYRALHPVYGAVSHRWRKHGGTEREIFRRGGTAEGWLKSPLYHMLEHQLDEFRADPTDPATCEKFPVLKDFQDEGATDYLAAGIRFGDGPRATVDDPGEGVSVTFTSDAPDGFTDRDIEDLRLLLPYLGITLHAGASRQMTLDLLSVYLGGDAGARVMSGEIDRGSAEDIDAVILLFDLSGFTRMSESLQGPDIIALLNDYFGMVVREVEDHGGNVLKFMGDGMLAVFAQQPEAEAARRALDAVQAIRVGIEAMNLERGGDDLPTTGCTMALHAGRVLYGNIGGETRLDFTVIGPAVNTTARIANMCDPLDQRIVISERVARPWIEKRENLVSLGAYRMRGVADRVELFTLD